MTKKINLIFDLDETLVQLGEENYNNKGIFIKNNKFLFIRPYCKELLNYCYKNYRVSFWTSGSAKYCKKILTTILDRKQLRKTKIIICKHENKFLELKTTKIYQPIKYYLDDTVVSSYVKSLNLLWNLEEFNKKFKILNTLIIDDNFFLEKINPQNYIKITAWCRYMKYDNALERLRLWLNDNKSLLLKLSKKKKKLLLLNLISNPEFDKAMLLTLGENIDSILKSSYNCRENLIINEV
jgi:hypothetical protein